MLLTEVYAEGFRCFSAESPLDLRLRKGMNVFVGENESGKTAIIDAIRLALGVRSEDYLRLSIDDFHVGSAGRAEHLVVRCTLDNLTEPELRRFLEWCVIEGGKPRLFVHVSGRLQTRSGGRRRVWSEHRGGRDGDGPSIDGALREYLRVAYLRPLRDAERELRPGRRSRLSQILTALPELQDQAEASSDPKKPSLATILKTAQDSISDNTGITGVQRRINKELLNELLFEDDDLAAKLQLGADMTLAQVFERLELALVGAPPLHERVPRGLGVNNVLFMAAELLLLQSADDQMPALLVEEPEAHVHPQLQARVVRMLEKRLSDDRSQVLLTTHSPLLAAGAELDSLTYCYRGRAYSLRQGATKLDKSDYAFLKRFLDATKANLFFARGVLVVEGDSENLLLPVLAEKLGRPLAAHGVSIVNVGHTGLFRYSRIFQRAGDKQIPIPVACVADRDIPPDEARGLDDERPKKTASDYTPEQIDKREQGLRRDAGFPVEVFVSDHWTLEYDLAVAGLAVELHQATALARENPDHKNRATVLQKQKKEIEHWRKNGDSEATIACRVYAPMYKRTVSKVEVAEQLVDLLAPLFGDLEARLPPYLVEAIKYVTSPLAPPITGAEQNDGASSGSPPDAAGLADEAPSANTEPDSSRDAT